MIPLHRKELIELIKADGYCGFVVSGCEDCVLSVQAQTPSITGCGISRELTPREAFSQIKDKAIDRLVSEGFQDDVIGMLL